MFHPVASPRLNGVPSLGPSWRSLRSDTDLEIEAPADPAEGGLAPATLPRRHAEPTPPPSGLGSFGLGERAVTAVMLGVTGIGVVASMSTPVLAAEAEAGVLDEAHALDERRSELDDSELATARRALWSSWVDASERGGFIHVAAVDTSAVALLPLSGSVGVGATNAKADLTKVQTRLAELGFDVQPDGKMGKGTERALRIFEAMISGAEELSQTSGRLTPNGPVHIALSSPQAPRWMKLPDSGIGFTRGDYDGFDHGSSTLVEVLVAAGQRYSTNYLASHPGRPPITWNDASRKAGGPTSDHETHQAGLDLDVRLPRLDGGTGSRVGWATYDRDTTRAIVAAFAEDPQVERVLITDRVLLKQIGESDVKWKGKVMDGGALHRSHIHIDVAPTRVISAAPGAVA